MKTLNPPSGFQIKYIAMTSFKRLYISYFMTSIYMKNNFEPPYCVTVVTILCKPFFRYLQKFIFEESTFFGRGGGSNI